MQLKKYRFIVPAMLERSVGICPATSTSFFPRINNRPLDSSIFSDLYNP